jgi:tetratricopeptide (TPR) repeat protein
MDLLTLDPVDSLDTADGLALAARGDWHAAATVFEAALDAAEHDQASSRAERNARLAAALTNLGQARAYLGALDEAAALLARSAALREALVSAGRAGVAVAVRGHMDLAAVYGASGDVAVARESLRHARTLLGDADPALARQLDEGLTLLGD